MTIVGLIGIIVGILLSPLIAGGVNASPLTDGTQEHTISVTGSGIVKVKPDAADVTLGVDVTRATLSEARDAAARQMNDVLAAIHALGITDADIETSQLSMNPVYDYNGTQRITGYAVSNLITVHVKNLDQVADVVDDSVTAGASTVQGITFKVSDQTAAEAQARQEAVRDARARADALAGAAGVSITGVQSISESSFSPPVWYGRPEFAGADRTTPIIPGMNEVSVTVSVTYLIP